MAKSKWDSVKDKLTLVEAWARDGLIDEQIMAKLGISKPTFYEYQKKYPNFLNAIKRGKEIVDVEVENALLQKALGFKETIKKGIKVKEVLYTDGKRTSEKEHIEYVDEEVFIPPDTTAQIFWLKNRKPKEWRDKQEIEHSGETGVRIINDIPRSKT